jgi:hypothetical protein
LEDDGYSYIIILIAVFTLIILVVLALCMS